MKLKKLLSLVLSVMLILGAVSGLSFAAEDTERVYGRDSMGIVNALGIAELTEEELSSKITRAEFLKMMSIASGYGEMKSEEVLFSDLPLENKYEPYIKALVKAGAVKGDGDKIYPDGEIGLSEAAAIAVRLTGYSLMAEARGGYPSGYYSVAKSKDILKNLPSSQYTVLTKGMAAKLTENVLKADLMIQTGFGSEITFEEKDEVNFLWTIFKVKYLEGVVTGVDISRVAGVNDVTPFHVDIDGFEIEAKDVENPRDYLGYKVNAYYSEERSDIPKLVWIEKSDKNTENVIDADDVISISGQRIKAYDENNREKSYSFVKSIPVIFNGASTAKSFTMALFEGKHGKIRLVDNNGDKTADVAILDIFDTYVVSQVDTANSIIYDEYNSAKKIELNIKKDNPYVIIYGAEGKETTISKIAAGSIVCVFSSAPDAYQQYIRAYIVDKTAEGTISRTKDNGDTVIIGSSEYDLTEECKKNCKNLIKPGQTVKLYMDYAGNVAYMKKSEGDPLVFGYLIAVDAGWGLDSRLKLKIFTTEEEFVVFETAKKIKLDGNTYNSDDAVILTKLNEASQIMFPGVDASCMAQVLRYALNTDGQVCTIDTLLNGTTGNEATRYESDVLNDSLFSAACKTSDYYQSSYRTLGPQIAMTAATVGMQYPSPLESDINDENLYILDSASGMFSNDQNNYKARAFYSSSDEYFTSFVGCINSGAASYNITAGTHFAVVDEYTQVYDKEKDEARDSLTLITIDGKQTLSVEDGFKFAGIDNEAAGLYTEMTVDRLKKGDVIRYRADKRGYIKNIIFHYRTDGDIFVTTSGVTTDFRGARTIRRGLVYDKFEKGFMIYYPEDEAVFESKDLRDVTPDKCELVVGTGASSVYYSYEEGRTGEMEVKTTDMNNLKSYKDTGSDCSRVLIQTYYGSPRAVLMY